MNRNEKSVLQRSRSDKMVRSYFILFAVSLVLTVVGMLLTRGRSFTDTLFYNYRGNGDTFMDFYNSMRDAGTKQVYKNGVIYPPLANLLFFLLSGLVDPKLIALPYEQRFELQSDTTCRIIIVVYLVVCLVPILLMLQKEAKSFCSAPAAWGLSLALMLSYPMVYCIQRGNLLLLSMALSIFFVFYRGDERKWVRELSLVALAIAAGFKLYPAVLGLLLVRDKEYKRALRLIVYGLIFTILPFFFYDGFESMRDLAVNLQAFSEAKKLSPAYVTTDVFATYITMILPIRFNIVHWLLFLPTMAAALVMFFLCEEEWKRVFCLVYLFMNLNSSGQTYILIFLLIPFVLFLSGAERRKTDRLNFLLFALLLIAIPVLYYRLINPNGEVLLETRKFMIRPNQLLAAPALHGMLLTVTAETIVALLQRKRGARDKKEV